MTSFSFGNREVQKGTYVPTCDYGCPELCGQPATWISYPDKFPTHLYACDAHAPKMFEAHLARRLPSAPPLSMEDLKSYVTALAWSAYLLRHGSDRLRYENARAAFSNARDEYEQRKQASA